MNTKNIGTRIKKYRLNKDLSAKQMADFLNITESTYYKIERGELEVSIKRIEQIVKILEIDLEQLLNSEQSVFISNNQNMTLNSVYLTAENVYFYDDKKIQSLIDRIEFLENENKKRK